MKRTQKPHWASSVPWIFLASLAVYSTKSVMAQTAQDSTAKAPLIISKVVSDTVSNIKVPVLLKKEALPDSTSTPKAADAPDLKQQITNQADVSTKDLIDLENFRNKEIPDFEEEVKQLSTNKYLELSNDDRKSLIPKIDAVEEKLAQLTQRLIDERKALNEDQAASDKLNLDADPLQKRDINEINLSLKGRKALIKELSNRLDLARTVIAELCTLTVAQSDKVKPLEKSLEKTLEEKIDTPDKDKKIEEKKAVIAKAKKAKQDKDDKEAKEEDSADCKDVKKNTELAGVLDVLAQNQKLMMAMIQQNQAQQNQFNQSMMNMQAMTFWGSLFKNTPDSSNMAQTQINELMIQNFKMLNNSFTQPLNSPTYNFNLQGLNSLNSNYGLEALLGSGAGASFDFSSLNQNKVNMGSRLDLNTLLSTVNGQYQQNKTN